MNDPDNFLARWSRRKSERQRDAKREESSDSDTPVPAETAAAPDAATKPTESSAAATDDPTAFDLASLPSIESIGADTDIRAFLQPGVPPEMRNAALRRAWSVDPAIRDFKGLQENDWNFNDPNGIPGFGPLSPTLDVQKMASALFGKTTTDSESAAAPAADQNAEPERSDGGTPAQASVAEAESLSEKTAAESTDGGGEKNIASQNINSESNIAPLQRRRSRGGALPQT
jgi:hypothetical protein